MQLRAVCTRYAGLPLVIQYYIKIKSIWSVSERQISIFSSTIAWTSGIPGLSTSFDVEFSVGLNIGIWHRFDDIPSHVENVGKPTLTLTSISKRWNVYTKPNFGQVMSNKRSTRLWCQFFPIFVFNFKSSKQTSSIFWMEERSSDQSISVACIQLLVIQLLYFMRNRPIQHQ